MKLCWLIVVSLVIVGCRSGFLPAQPYTITDTHHERDSRNCKSVSKVLSEQ